MYHARLFAVALSASAAFVLPAHADNAAAVATVPAHPGEDQAKGAHDFVANMSQQAITLIADKSLSDSQRVDKFGQIFVSTFDLPAIGQFVLGRYWRTASPDQQQKFLTVYKDFEVLTWANRFKSYNGEHVQIGQAIQAQDGAWQVDSSIDRPNGPPIPLQWTIHLADGQWRITDITVEGASMAVSQRQEFSSVIQAKGGHFDELISAMSAKVSQLRGS